MLETRAWVPVEIKHTNVIGERSAEKYTRVLEQFNVEKEKRYQRKGDFTYCNIFVWDVTRAMGCEIPHWIDENGNSCRVGEGDETRANTLFKDWLPQHGAQQGWTKVAAENYEAAKEHAQNLADQGFPVVAIWHNPKGPGHIAMVRPNGWGRSNAPRIAQAGATCSSDMHLTQGFGSHVVEFWSHL